jgi:2'-hydroxyisoflavone reductase
LALGLRFRPLEDTLRATLEFANSRPVDWVWRAGLTAERESELLRLWEERK